MKNVDLSKLLNSYFEAYQDATKNMADLVAWPLSQNKLSFEQFLILRRITDSDQVTLNDIAVQRQVTRSAISRQVKALLTQHYVFQVPDPQDAGDSICIWLNADNRSKILSIKPLRNILIHGSTS